MTAANTSTAYTAAFELVADERRRELLRLLRVRDDAVTVEELATLLATAERGRCGADSRRRIVVGLRHLPTLADRSVVEYDPEDGTVRYRADEFVETLLELTADERAVAVE